MAQGTMVGLGEGPTGQDEAFLGHPRGLATLFMTELWERFSFYGMRGLLTLFLVTPASRGGMGLDTATALGVYSVYNSLIYMLSMPGGWLADRLWGARTTVLIGGVVITAGHFVLAIPQTTTFYLGLALIAVGTGMLKPNVSSIVGALYAKDDLRRDGGFTLFYMSINLGAFLAPLVIGTVGQRVNWHLGFSLAGVGMCLGLAQYVRGARHLGAAGLLPARPAAPAERRRALRLAGLWGGLAVSAFGVDAGLGTFSIHQVVNLLATVGVLLPVLYFARMRRDRGLTAQDRARIGAYVWFFVAAAVFWMIYDQTGSTLTVFATTQTDLSAFGFRFPSSWFQSVNPLLIVVLAPVFAWIWQSLARRGREPGTPGKFATGLLLIGLSFGVMGLASIAARGGTLVSPLWLVSVYLIQTLGELFLSPVGLSVTTKLAPAKFVSQMLGLWFLASATGDAVAGWTTQLTRVMSQNAYFCTQGGLAVLCAVAFSLAAGRIRALMRGVN
ncbi:peptide MFS transporter [Streptacidiphilus sp. EB129]|uniref:peptide MFS transporter n=1 Tax=Streptacidiphilus sp. EB129 TaxID=3156262 RepID=UPI0035112D6C